MTTKTCACVVSSSLALATIVGVGAQGPVPDPATRPRFSQASTNVFRRFSVDLARMKEFYGEVVGLGALPPIGMPGGGQMTRFHVGRSEIKLQPSASEAGAPSGAVGDVTGLRVLTFYFTDEAAVAGRLKAHGLPVPEPRDEGGHQLASMVQDPSGQWVQLVIVPGGDASLSERLDVGLTVSDLARSRAFYREFVGLEELPPTPDPVLGVTKYRYRLGTTTINLWAAKGTAVPANRTSAGIQYIVVNVADVDARAKAQHIQIDRPLGNFSANLRTVWLADPDGITNYFAQVQGRPEVPTR